MSVSWAKPTTISAWRRISRSFSCKNAFPATNCCIMASNRCNGSVPVYLNCCVAMRPTALVGDRKCEARWAVPIIYLEQIVPKKQSKPHSLHRHQKLLLFKTQCQTCGWLFLFHSTKLTLKKEFINAVGRQTSRMFSWSPSSKFAGV